MKYISILIFLCLVSCTSSVRLPSEVIDKEIPTIAVLEFENKAKFYYDWDIGYGIRDSLVDELVRSKRYKVVTRGDIDAVISELQIQQDQLFRPEGKVKTGRLQNVKYLLKGSVTDFAHVAGGGVRAFFRDLGLASSGDLAIVTVTLYVIDVESGEIIASKQVEGKAYAANMDVEGQYKGVRFGSGGFYRTPLGKACKELIGEAMEEVGTVIAKKTWYPKVIKSEVNKVLITGGEDRGLSIGDTYTAFHRGNPLTDPSTGDLLGYEESRTSGLIQVIEVKEKYSVCELVDGEFQRGQHLRPFETK